MYSWVASSGSIHTVILSAGTSFPPEILVRISLGMMRVHKVASPSAFTCSSEFTCKQERKPHFEEHLLSDLLNLVVKNWKVIVLGFYSVTIYFAIFDHLLPLPKMFRSQGRPKGGATGATAWGKRTRIDLYTQSMSLNQYLSVVVIRNASEIAVLSLLCLFIWFSNTFLL